jgi:hypothetical protein
METDPVSKTLRFLASRILDNGQSPKAQQFWVDGRLLKILMPAQYALF